MLRFRSVASGVVLVATSLTIAACGSDDDASPSSAATEATDAATEVTGATTDATQATTGSSGSSADTVTDGSSAPPDAEPRRRATARPPRSSSPRVSPTSTPTFIYGYPITVSRLDPHRASISQDATTLFPVYDRLVAPVAHRRPHPAASPSRGSSATTA